MSWLDYLFPQRCVFCGKLLQNQTKMAVCEPCFEENYLTNDRRCEICDMHITAQFGDGICLKCRKNMPKFERGFCACLYTDAVRSALLRFKFWQKSSYARTFAALIYTRIRAKDPYASFDLVTYVPLRARREALHGYNQGFLLANCVSKILNTPCFNVFKRISRAAPQSTLSARARLENIKGQFGIRYKRLEGKTILIVDDVTTTGATLNECAKVLLANGAKKVYVATVATPKKK